jgi:hypothetical protein
VSQVWEEIITLAGEGGRFTLFGSKNANGTWMMFRKETNEALLADLLDDEDLSGIVHQKSGVVTNWTDAIALLGRSWMHLHPRFVHPEFKQLIWSEVSSSEASFSFRHWERLCLTDS